ncbi:MAG: hypothetical protein A2Y76_12640 [Planctomycetes bacterium RBG_13_60_9]|nr:MAG: hypothetical protein A2Y76_12640 [Planctomycetes bacterium RBG_13_60_9]
MTEDRRPKTEDGRQRAAGRGHKTGSRAVLRPPSSVLRRPLFVVLFTLLPLLLLAGCKNRELERVQKETSDAKAALDKRNFQLNTVVKENAAIKAELSAVRQDRDELQKQVDKLKQERDQAATFAQTAQEAITHLTTQATGQSSATAALEKQIAELKTLVDQQQALIDQLKKGPAGEPSSAMPAEPNDKP